MKAISLWQPWASLWLSPMKINETRHWPTKHRGWLAVHAALRFERKFDADDPLPAICFKHFGPNWTRKLPVGAIIGAIYLEDCRQMTEVQPCHQDDEECGNWSAERYAWRRSNDVVTIKPVPFKGRQGFFDIPDLIVPVLPYTVPAPARQG